MSLAVKHNGVFVTWLITKYDWSRKACLRTSSVMPPLPSLYYEYSPILLPPNRGASLLFIRSRRSRLESPRSMRNSALSTYSSVLSSKAQTSGFSCLNNSTICLSKYPVNRDTSTTKPHTITTSSQLREMFQVSSYQVQFQGAGLTANS